MLRRGGRVELASVYPRLDHVGDQELAVHSERVRLMIDPELAQRLIDDCRACLEARRDLADLAAEDGQEDSATDEGRGHWELVLSLPDGSGHVYMGRLDEAGMPSLAMLSRQLRLGLDRYNLLAFDGRAERIARIEFSYGPDLAAPSERSSSSAPRARPLRAPTRRRDADGDALYAGD